MRAFREPNAPVVFIFPSGKAKVKQTGTKTGFRGVKKAAHPIPAAERKHVRGEWTRRGMLFPGVRRSCGLQCAKKKAFPIRERFFAALCSRRRILFSAR